VAVEALFLHTCRYVPEPGLGYYELVSVTEIKFYQKQLLDSTKSGFDMCQLF